MRVFLKTLLLLFPLLGYGQLSVNEVMPQNSTAITDNFNQYEDWIEIYNDGSSSINLSGYYLTDDPANLDKHEIDSGNDGLTTVPANGYLIFWADEDGSQGENHLNFKLSDGETVLLVAPDATTIISSLTLPSLKDDESFGSTTDGSNSTRIFEVATPLASNASSLDAAIEFSVSSRSFVTPFNLLLSTSATGGVIRYTTNGSNPTSSSPIYTGILPIALTTTVKAAFFFNIGNVSLIKTERYVLMSNALANTSSDLPIILIHTYNQVLDATTSQTTFWSVIEPNNGGRAYGSDEPSFAGRTAMKIRGASSSSFAKKQWRCEIQNEDGSDRDVELIGMPADADWTLYAPGRFDRGLINNALMYEMSNKLGKWAPRTRFVEVYYNEGAAIGTGDYWGIYILTEKIKVDNNRVDIRKIDSNDNAEEDLTGGYMFSLDREEDIVTTYTQNYYGSSNVGYELRAPDNADITTAQLNYITNEITGFENALTSAQWLNPATGYKTKTNIDSWMVPHVLKALSKEPDGFHLSFYLQKDKNDLLEAGPIWDFDRAINSPDTRSADYFGWDTSAPGSPAQGNVYYWKGGVNSGAYINQMVNDPDYETLIYDNWFDWRRNSVLEVSNIHAIIDSMVNVISESQVREFNRWGANDANYAPRYGGFGGEISQMKTWFQNRADWMDGQFLGPPDFSPGSATVSLNSTVTLTSTSGAGTIYYTLDGADPRKAGGAVSSTAISYASPIQIAKKGLTFITARTRLNSGDWSAICTQEYYVAEDYSGLVINEIHYNPRDEITAANDTIDGTNFEFIELKNRGNTPINLNGIDFIQGGVDLYIQNCLTIPANGFVVLADDSQWFQYKYGFAPDAEYKEKLDNGGELLHLVDPNKNFIDSLSYNDAIPWPSTADKGYYSLALKDCALDNALPSSWGIQSVFTTPKAENFFTDFGEHGFSGIVINEIHYNPFSGTDASGNVVDGKNYEFVELKNITAAEINLTGVFFSRGIDYFFPDNTMLNPGQIIVLAEDAFYFQDRYGFAPFDTYGGKLSDDGETIWLNKSDGVLLDAVSYSSIFPWDTQANGGLTDFSLALIDGTVNNNTHLNWRVQCGSLYTPGAENDLSCFNGLNYNGLVITEFHYSPSQGNNYEFLELHNNSNILLNLEEVRVSSAVTFKFRNFLLGSNQYLILAQDSVLFENTYGITPYGEYTGGLSNNGETILIKDLFNNTIDSVAYGVASPWSPEPLQGIKSLALIDADMDNVLAQSWCTQQPDITPKAINIFEDNDNDLIVDCIDSCPNFDNDLIGTICEDGDPCTTGETYNSACNCVGGTFQDSDNDGVCDANDVCGGQDDAIIGTPCSDGDPCTTGETFSANCTCTGGVYQDTDNDGICDANDACPGQDDALIGTSCNDGNPCTVGEIYDANCNCSGGVFQDADNDGVCDANDTCAGQDDAIIGTSCSDGDPCTSGEIYNINCNCVGGVFQDADGDGICDANDVCAGQDDALVGTPCSDGDPCTTGETYDANCNCVGAIFQDADGDGVCDANDQCANFDDALIGQSCDDGDVCTTGEVYHSDCNCAGGQFLDLNNNDVCDVLDGGCEVVYLEDFETGSGIWQSGGEDAERVTSANSPEGDDSFRIRDNSGPGSSVSSSTLDLSSVDNLKLRFQYQGIGMEINESFDLQISNDNGASFTTVQTWTSGIDFSNNVVYVEEINISAAQLSSTVILRFECHGSINSDEIFLDKIILESCGSCTDYVTDINFPTIQNDKAALIGIESNGTVPASSMIDFNAGDFISLKEGFEVELGAVFHAFIQPCN